MPLSPGDRLGPYEIVSPLGKGGMGEVWKARDPRLNRDVAIKVSAQQFTDRFEREAHAIAALNHSNVCTLYDVGPNYLVMELVEGPTLAERIAQGPIPLDEALRIAKQIADALEAAHEKSIVHRDLKPANIKIKPDGSVKVLDFGLAKTGEVEALTSDSPTLLTVHGMILGTAGYMAPEQAAGQPVDKRADVWAYGVVLYEVLTGQRLFPGDSVAHILADVLRGPIDFDKLPKETPRRIRHLMKRCLDRDLRTRLRDIREARVAIEGVDEESEGATAAPLQSRFGRSVPWALAAVLFLASVGLGFVAWRHYSEEPQLMRMSLQTPDKAQLAGFGAIPKISPDGRRVAFAPTVDGKTGLWVRDLDGLSGRQLPGTDGAISPFWSPDSRWIAFFAGGKLKKVDVTGGPALTLCDIARGGASGAWSKEDLIVYAIVNGALFRVPAAGGTPTPLNELDPAASEASNRAPWFLPDGRHFLYTTRSINPLKTRIYVDSIDAKPGSHTRREVLAAASNAVYVPRVSDSLVGGSSNGYLLFVRETTLMAQPFDTANARVTGDAAPVAEQVDYLPGNAQGQFSASRNGVLVYTSGASSGTNVQLTWFDRMGKPSGTVGAPGPIQWASISPDGSTVAADRQDASGLWDIWLLDLARGAASRFTFGPGNNEYPLWSPDASKIAFYSTRSGQGLPYQKASSGVGREEGLDLARDTLRVADWSHDGRYLIENVTDLNTTFDIWVLPTFGDKKRFSYLNTEFKERNAKLAPNGQFLAYMSDESKRNEVYVQTFPEHGGKWQVSTEGGDFPVWSRDGRELYFISADNKMMAVEVKGDGKKFDAGVPKPLFPVLAQAQFDVSKDGRFLIHVPQEQAGTNVPLTVVVNWQSGLKASK